MEKIIVRAPNWLGDCIMSTPFISRLKKIHPESSLTVLCRSMHSFLYKAHPDVADVQNLDDILTTAKRLRRMKYGLGYILPTSFSSALLFQLAEIPVRIGFAGEFRSFMLTKSIATDKRYHYIRRYLSILGYENVTSEPELFFPANNLNNAELQKGSTDTLTIGLAIGSRAPARRWPAKKFASLSDRLIENLGCKVILLGESADAVYAEEFMKLLAKPVLNLVGKTSLEELGTVLSKCGLIITNESGLMHAAWALNIPSVIIAGPSNPALTSPWGSQVRILWHNEIPCVPCVRNECPRKGNGHMECLEKISVNEVLTAAQQLLRQQTT